MTDYKVKIEREYDSLTAMKRANKVFLREWIISFLKRYKSPKILDMGCFQGEMMRLLKEHGYNEVQGIELNKKSRIMSQRYGKVHDYDLERDLPIPDKSFDVILEIDIHEHLYNIENFVKETNRILKDKGEVIIFTSNHQHWTKRIQFLFGYIGYKAFGFGEHHVRFVSHDILQKLLRRYFYIRHIPRSYIFNNLLKRHCWYVCKKKRF